MVFQSAHCHSETAARALLELRRRRADAVVLSCSMLDGQALAIVEPGHVLRSTLAMNALVEVLCTTAVSFSPSAGASSEYWAVQPTHLDSLERLCWMLGMRLAREQGLLPWLSMRRRYRLLAWPDFGEIGNDPQGVALCGLLTQELLSPQQVSQRMGWPGPQVAALFNALALCGALVEHEPNRAGSRGGLLASRQTVGSPARHKRFADLWRRLTT